MTPRERHFAKTAALYALWSVASEVMGPRSPTARTFYNTLRLRDSAGLPIENPPIYLNDRFASVCDDLGLNRDERATLSAYFFKSTK